MFYPELPKAQGGVQVPPDNDTPIVGDKIEMGDGSIYVYTQNADGTFGYVPENATQASANAVVVNQSPSAVTQNVGAPTGKPPIGSVIEVDGQLGRVTGYDESTGKPKLKKVSNDDPYFLKGSQRDYTSDYNELETALSDPEVKEALWKEYQKTKSSYKVKGKGSAYKNVKDADELVKRFLKTQRAIMILNSKTSEDEFKDLNLDANKANRDRILGEYGIDETDLTAFQKTFYDLKDLSVDNTVPKNVRTKLDQFNWTGSGPVDPDDSESLANKKGAGNISFIDAIFGDNTSRQIATTKQKTPPPPNKDCPPGQKRNPVTGLCEDINTGGDIPVGGVGKKGKIPEVGWFPQDRNNLYGALADWTGTKKYMPWMPEADFANYDPTFYDPSRALANINEQTNIGVQGMNAYSNPQAYVAGYNQMQGRAAEQAANTLGQYENLNVGVANDAAKYNAEVDTKQALYNAQKTGNYYDQITTANQQFDNSRNLARRNIINAYNTGLSNKAMANTMNYMHPYEYFLDPSDGGSIRLNQDNLPQSLDASYKADAQRREEQLAKFLDDTRWSPYDNDAKMDIYDRIYPGEALSRSPRRQRGQANDQDLAAYYQMMQQMGLGFNPTGG
jgi:hypothetical protein